MEAWMGTCWLRWPCREFGLTTVFMVALVSATLLPMGSEPAVFGLVKLSPELFWPAIFVATVGNTLGGAISWWMGYGAERAYERTEHTASRPRSRRSVAAALRAQGLPAELAARRRRPAVRGGRLAAAAVLAVRGYMAVGKFLRYLTMTTVLLWVFPGQYVPG
jgi:membrane protein YqaA with SNARE-associated domain